MEDVQIWDRVLYGNEAGIGSLEYSDVLVEERAGVLSPKARDGSVTAGIKAQFHHDNEHFL